MFVVGKVNASMRQYSDGRALGKVVMARVFISYSSQDSEIADRVYSRLEAADHEVWMDRAALRGGDSWLPVIQEKILWSDTMVILWSDNALKSRWVLDELTYAHARGKQIIPLQLDHTDGSENLIINARQMIDARGARLENALEMVANVLSHGYTVPDETRPRREYPAHRPFYRQPLAVLLGGIALVIIAAGLLAALRPVEPGSIVTLTVSGTTPPTLSPGLTPSPVADLIPATLDTLNVWRGENGYAPFARDDTLQSIADLHLADLRSRPLSEPSNEYRDQEGRDAQQMADNAGYGGPAEMFVVISDEPLSLDDMLNEMVKRGGEDIHTRYDEAGFAWVQAIATEKHNYVMVLGTKGDNAET